MINADKANINSNQKVKVAIIDSGVDAISGIKVKERINLVDDKEDNLLFFEDYSGHGTSVAGIIAGSNGENNVEGINPNVELYSAKVLDDNNAAPISRVIEGIYWAIEQDVDIINLSLGTTVYSEALEKATGKLTQLKKEIEKEEIAVSGQRTLLQQIDQYVEQNFKNKISLDEIADELHVNRSYLSRFYKNKTGINLFDTILNLRIEAAKEYLLNTDMKTYEISEAIGVDDAGYFSKMFKKITGVSPKEFRKQGKDEKNY